MLWALAVGKVLQVGPGGPRGECVNTQVTFQLWLCYWLHFRCPPPPDSLSPSLLPTYSLSHLPPLFSSVFKLIRLVFQMGLNLSRRHLGIYFPSDVIG